MRYVSSLLRFASSSYADGHSSPLYPFDASLPASAVIVNDIGALNVSSITFALIRPGARHSSSPSYAYFCPSALYQIDAALLSNHKVTQKEETVVQMQNGEPSCLSCRPGLTSDSSLTLIIRVPGCICCTLRGDLLEEIADLAEKKEFESVRLLPPLSPHLPLALVAHSFGMLSRFVAT